MNHKKKSYFDNHPKAKEFHFTSDGLAFFRHEDAAAHAVHLEQDEIKTHTREEAEAWAKEQEAGNAEGDGNTTAPANYSKMNKEQLQAACTEKEIEYADGDTNKVLIDKLKEADAAAAGK